MTAMPPSTTTTCLSLPLLPLPVRSSRREEITTGIFRPFSASGCPQRSPGPSRKDPGWKSGPAEGLWTSGGRRCEKNTTSEAGYRSPLSPFSPVWASWGAFVATAGLVSRSWPGQSAPREVAAAVSVCCFFRQGGTSFFGVFGICEARSLRRLSWNRALRRL